MAAFLALPADRPLELTWNRVGRDYLGHVEHGYRLVVFAPALNGRLSNTYIANVRELLHDQLVRRIPERADHP